MQELKLLEKFLRKEIELAQVMTEISEIKEQQLLSTLAHSFSLFENEQTSPETFYFFSKKIVEDEEIVFFPGSFHPWHQGHQECLKQCPIKNVIVMPDQNPEKNFLRPRPLESYLTLLSQDEVKRHYLYPGFLLLSENNPTHRWIRKLRVRQKNILMGDDSFMSILSWINGVELLRMLHHLIVLPRFFLMEDYKLHEDRLRRINPDIKITYLNDHPFKKLSSRSIRPTS